MQRLTKHDIKTILSDRFKDDKCLNLSMIPKPSTFKDIKKAAKRVKQAIENSEKIAIVGDYDVDGVTASVIMAEFFDDLGVKVSVKIPNRFQDGYGISKEIVKDLDASLIITVDNGISANEAAIYCKEHSIDLIITDHHTVPENIPEAYAIVNPKQEGCNFPNSEICGAQVAWYLIAAIKEEMKLSYDLSKYLDLLAIAIVADMVSLKDINRVMVKSGLKCINKSNRAVFSAIKKFFNKDYYKSEDISFLISPLINSAGRMEDAIFSYELLRAKNEQEAIEKLEYIIFLNNQRKDIEQKLYENLKQNVDKTKNIIVAWGEGWHEGVIGIVASKLTRTFQKPAIIFSISGDKAKGSARSVGEIDIYEHIVKYKELLLGFGGHKGAAGISIDVKNLEVFKDKLEKSFDNINKDDFISKNEILGEIDIDVVDFELLTILESYEPYGQQNPMPNFVMSSAYIKLNKIIGKNKNHQKLILKSGNKSLESLYFNFEEKIESGKKIDFIFSISKNQFRGKVTPQLMIKKILSYK